jgi:hypothetical protein
MEAPQEIAVRGRIRWARKAARLGRAMSGSGMPSSQSAGGTGASTGTVRRSRGWGRTAAPQRCLISGLCLPRPHVRSFYIYMYVRRMGMS